MLFKESSDLSPTFGFWYVGEKEQWKQMEIPDVKSTGMSGAGNRVVWKDSDEFQG